MTRTLDRTTAGGQESRPPGAMAQPQPHEAIWALATAGFSARCLHVVADRGVADHIDDHAVPVGDLAVRCGVAVDPLDRVLRLLATHGVFVRQGDAYAHPHSSQLLRDDHAMTMRPFAQMMGLPFAWGALTELEHSVRTGRPSVETLEPRGLWAYLGEHADEAEVFGRAMTAKAAAEVAAVVAAYDFGRFATIADIGGGRGHLLSAVLEATPAATGTLFDLPEVTATLELRHPRLTVHAGNFFAERLPAADAYLLMEILHDWADEKCVEILRAVRRRPRRLHAGGHRGCPRRAGVRAAATHSRSGHADGDRGTGTDGGRAECAVRTGWLPARPGDRHGRRHARRRGQLRLISTHAPAAGAGQEAVQLPWRRR
jgi:C-methyltransferase